MTRSDTPTTTSHRLAALKRRLPAPLLGALRQVRARTSHVMAWPGRPLRHTLPSGIDIRLTNISDWTLYNEIFVDGEYDAAFDLLERSVGNPRWVLDLGANVGFFSLRLADRIIRSSGSLRDVRIIAVEGCPHTYSRLAVHLGQPALAPSCAAHCALVGRRGGAGYISLSAHSGMNSILDRQSFSRAKVTFVDLESLIPSDARIALLKCDIEGAERLLLESYRSLLDRVSAAVFEFHHRLVDVRHCRQLLAAAGLTQLVVLREYDGASVELFARR